MLLRQGLAFVALFQIASLVVAAPAADAPTPAAESADVVRACAGISNDVTKTRALMRELAPYAGLTVPVELAERVNKHIDTAQRMKAECERLRAANPVARSQN